MKVGAEPKKVAILAGLVVIGAYLFYQNVLSSPTGPVEARPAVSVPAATPAPQPVNPAPTRRVTARSRSSEDFRPSLRPRRPEERVDPTRIDPTLRLDLLAKVQAVELQGGQRNLFQFSAPPPKEKEPEPKIVPQPVAGNAKPGEAPKPLDPPKPPPPPINLKYYGYTSSRGSARRLAFFLDGDEILVAGEGDTLKKRYKVVRIGVNSVVMEDLDNKNQQTLPLQPDTVG